MAELHVIGALRNKRSELAGLVKRLAQQLAEQRTSLAHLDATMRMFDPRLRPEMIRPPQQRIHNVWFRPAECLRLINDVLCDALEPVTTRVLAERLMMIKDIPADGLQRSASRMTRWA